MSFRNNQPLCKFWERGNCKFGTTCNFVHQDRNQNQSRGGGFGNQGGSQSTQGGAPKKVKSPDDVVKEALTTMWTKFSPPPLGQFYHSSQMGQGQTSRAIPAGQEGFIFSGLNISPMELFTQCTLSADPRQTLGEAIQSLDVQREQWLKGLARCSGQAFNVQLSPTAQLLMTPLPCHPQAQSWQSPGPIFPQQPQIQAAQSMNQATITMASMNPVVNNPLAPAAFGAHPSGTTPMDKSSILNEVQSLPSSSGNQSINNPENIFTSPTAPEWIDLGSQKHPIQWIPPNAEAYQIPDYSKTGIPLDPPPPALR